MSLHRTIQALAARFADDIVSAIRSASLQELLAETGGARRVATEQAGGLLRPVPAPDKRLARRTPAEIEKYVEAIVLVLKKNPKGMRAEQIQRALGLDKRETPRPIAAALAAKRITKKGEKRATTYFAK
jgi:hypothetical protein